MESFSPPFEMDLTNWGAPLYGLAVDTTNDGATNYDELIISKDKTNTFARLKIGEWSDWLPIKLEYEMKNDYNIHTPKKSELERELSVVEVLTETKIKLIKLGDKDQFRIRFLYNNLNEFLINPSELYESVVKNVGPMVDFVDNYPPQLIYFREDKNTFLEEAKLSYEWHRKMAEYMIRAFSSQVILHSIYTPNQMLTSRWWMPFLDPSSPRYNMVSEAERNVLWDEVHALYRAMDDIIGTVLDNTDDDTYVVMSSDHGAVPLYKEVRLNNLFAKKGWLKFHFNPATEEFEIDWDKTRVIFLQMDNIYIHTKGMKGAYYKDSGPAYEELRNEVALAMRELKDDDGKAPLAQILTREQAGRLNLPGDRTGDLIIANAVHYNWVEDVSEDLSLFKESFKGGYKQAVLPADNKGMWTPFIIKGPGIRPGYELPQPIHHIDQYATLMELLKVPAPAHANGRVLTEIMRK